nr:TIR domain-containing protein [uncultured Emticicia sp.]
MGLLDWLLGRKKNDKKVKSKKRIFISFAIEDVEYRDYLVEQARKKHSPFDFIDMSVKQEWNQDEWKKRCRTKIKRSHGVIALLSKNTHKAGGARWEMKCAIEEKIPIVGMHIKKMKEEQYQSNFKTKKL